MADNTQVNTGSGDVIRDIDRGGVKTQVMQLDAGGQSGESLVSNTNPLPVKLNALSYPASTLNSNNTQLGVGASFVGGLETILNQQAAQIEVVCDQTYTLSVYQYLDAGGTQLTSVDNFTRADGQPFNENITLPGNYFRLIVQNLGGSPTTGFAVDTTFGIMATGPRAPSNLGNAKVAIMEVSGKNTANGLPITLSNDPRNAKGLQVDNQNLNAAQTQDQPLFTAITGDPVGDFAGVNLLESVITGDLQFNVNVVNPPKLDPRGAMILSDAPAPIILNGPAGSVYYIDTIGYNSISFTSGTLVGSASIAMSNDGINWASATGFTTSSGNLPTSIIGNIASATTHFSCVARYMRVTITTTCSLTAYLRTAQLTQNPLTPIPTNLFVGTTTAVTGGLAGTLGVGGGSAIAVAPTYNPVTAGTVDTGTPGVLAAVPVTRRLLSDNQGRIRNAEEASVYPFNQGPLKGGDQGGTLNVQDSTQYEGQSIAELLFQILMELKIQSQQLYDLPQYLNSGTITQDDPARFRADPTFFNT
jgi:hypothetical protein